MDANTVMVEDFSERAIAEFDAVPELDAVGGVFVGRQMISVRAADRHSSSGTGAVDH
jgi:hypothetical protein